MVIFQNVTLVTVEDIDNSSVDNFEEVRCEIGLASETRLFVIASYDIETDTASLVIKMVENSVLEGASLNGTRVEDEDGL